MAERGRERRGDAALEATRDGSRRSQARTGLQAAAAAVTLAGLAAAVLMVVTEFTAVATVDVASGSCEVINDADPELADRCELSGFERNGGAFLVLAALTLPLAWGAGLGGSRPAAVALLTVGALVLAWSLLADLPVTSETGALGRNFDGAQAQAGPGFTAELAAGGLALAAGALALVAHRAPQRRTAT